MGLIVFVVISHAGGEDEIMSIHYTKPAAKKNLKKIKKWPIFTEDAGFSIQEHEVT